MVRKRLTKNKQRDKKRQIEQTSRDLYSRRLLSRIRTFDDPILQEKCEPVRGSSLGGDDITGIISTLVRVLDATSYGVGLAVSQIGFQKSIIAIRPNLATKDIQVMINPEVVEQSEATIFTTEGCLSYPGVQFNIQRSKEITVTYYDIDDSVKEGDLVIVGHNKDKEKTPITACLVKKTRKFEKREAVIVQHEIDHTLGVCTVGNRWRMKKKAEKSIHEAEERKHLLTEAKGDEGE